MKYWILAISLLVMGCSGGESGGSDESAAADVVDQVEEAAAGAGDAAADAVEDGADSMGDAAADAMNEAQDKAGEVGDLLEEKKEEIDAAIKEATDD